MKSRSLLKRNVLFSIGILLAVLIDQFVKYVVVLYVKPVSVIPVVDGILDLHYCENTGAAFSFLAGKNWFFIIATILFSIFLLFLLYTGRIRGLLAGICAMFIVAGGLGNLIDRCVWGYVVDMFELKFISFAIFNVADIFITCGAIVFIICYIFSKGEVIEWNSSRSKRTSEHD